MIEVLDLPALSPSLRLDAFPPERILRTPTPGTATEDDLLAHRETLVELIDGTLVEKAMGAPESQFTFVFTCFFAEYRLRHPDLGVYGLPDAMFRLKLRLVRMPDFSFTAWASLPNNTAHLEQVSDYAPDLAVEILSPSNTKAEMVEKVRDFFEHGTKLFWIIDPKHRTATVYTSPETFVVLTAADSLDGGDVLPGFALPLAKLFDDPQNQPRRPQLGGAS